VGGEKLGMRLGYGKNNYIEQKRTLSRHAGKKQMVQEYVANLKPSREEESRRWSLAKKI